jgi:hypothetical protein
VPQRAAGVSRLMARRDVDGVAGGQRATLPLSTD